MKKIVDFLKEEDEVGLLRTIPDGVRIDSNMMRHAVLSMLRPPGTNDGNFREIRRQLIDAIGFLEIKNGEEKK